jgi:putative membrane-bound dehydrogenase-like protein
MTWSHVQDDRPPGAGPARAWALGLLVALLAFPSPLVGGPPPAKAEAPATAEPHGGAPARVAPSPEAVLRNTPVAAGYLIELVAAEPAVVDPVAVTFDEAGRPYVVEYRDYPSGPPAGSPPLSRVVRLNDADGDGHFESSTAVAEHLPFSQGILAARGGLLVTASPDLLLLTDTDGDGTFETHARIATGFRVGNPQLRAACPTIGPDNAVWISGGLSGGSVRWASDPDDTGVSIDRRDVRLDLARGTIRAVTGFGQFGNTFDSRGHRFTASNRNPLMVSLLPPEALVRNALVDLGPGYVDAAPSGADSRVAAVAATNATAISHTGTHTSACGLTIFRGDLLGPEADGDAFTCEPVSHAVVRRRPVARGAGFWSSHPEPEGSEFVASAETWFRPVFTATAPDGSLWIVDFCRASVEHPDYMPPGVAATVDHRAGDRAGRIWRVRRADLFPRVWAPPATAAEAVALLADPNGWRRDTAQRLLVEGRFPAADAEHAVRALLDAPSSPPIARVHALRALDGLSRLTIPDLDRATASENAGLREEGLRLARAAEGIVFEASADPASARQALCDRVAVPSVDHPDGSVRLAALLALAGSPAEPALAVAAASPHLDAWTARAILSAAPGRAGPLLAAIARQTAAGDGSPRPPDQARMILVTQLATTATADTTSADLDTVLALLAARADAGQVEWFDVAALLGVAARRPVAWIRERHAATVDRTVARAHTLAADAHASADLRLLAIRLLALAAVDDSGPGIASRSSLLALAASREPEAVQREAVRGVVACGAPRALDELLTLAADLEPGVRSAAVAAMLDRPAAIPPLLAALDAGSIPAGAIPLERRKPLLESPDMAVRETALRLWGEAGSALAPEELARLTTAVRLGGDQPRGREVFARHCANCHRTATPGAEPLGQGVGPDLAEAADRPIERLLLDVVEPNRAVESRYEATVVVTDEGVVLEGILAANTPESIVLIRPGGERTQLPRERIESVRGTARSLMPEGFGRAIPASEFADLLAYLRQGRVIGPPP